jgi:hypothetical protein
MTIIAIKLLSVLFHNYFARYCHTYLVYLTTSYPRFPGSRDQTIVRAAEQTWSLISATHRRI